MQDMTSRSRIMAEAAEIADFIIETLQPHVAPCVIMWRESINAFVNKDVDAGKQRPLWNRDDTSVHEHFKRLGPAVIANLSERYSLTIVKVNATIRSRLKHGAAPNRDARRDDDFYRGCLSGPQNRTMGFVAFPRDAQRDHPLIVRAMRRQVKSMATGLENARQSVDQANLRGTLSSASREDIHRIALPVSMRMMQEAMPLLNKALPGAAVPDDDRAG
jgi:hypothetical protein